MEKSRPSSWWRSDWVAGLALVALVFLAFLRVGKAGFIWDDNAMLTQNPCIVGPKGFWDLWTTSAARICPLTLSTLWLLHHLWGLSPAPYHWFNVAMHAASGVALWRVLRSLNVPGAWWGAALWELHPVQAESVAWIAELKNTQSGFFYLLALLFFIRSLKGQGRVSYPLSLLFSAMAMASKTSTMVLPVIMGLCAWWLERRWRWGLLARLAPMLIMAMGACALSVVTQHFEATGAEPPVEGFAARLVQACQALGFYAGKLVWPVPLIGIYPRWAMDLSKSTTYLAPLAVLTLSVALWRLRSGRLRAVFFAWISFVVALFPVLGFFDHGWVMYSPVADHFQYLASMGPLALAGAGLSWWTDREKGSPAIWKCAVGAAILAVLGTLTWRHSQVFESSATFWTETLAHNRSSGMVYQGAGWEKFVAHDFEGALADWHRGLEIEPQNGEIHNSLAIALFELGRQDEAIEQFGKATRAWPKAENFHLNYCWSLCGAGRFGEAEQAYDRALEAMPDSTDLLRNSAWLLATCPQEPYRNGARARLLVERADLLSGGRDPFVLRTLAAAQAAEGDFSSALRTAGRALKQNSGHNSVFGVQLQYDCAKYRDGKPLSDSKFRP